LTRVFLYGKILAVFVYIVAILECNSSSS